MNPILSWYRGTVRPALAKPAELVADPATDAPPPRSRVLWSPALGLSWTSGDELLLLPADSERAGLWVAVNEAPGEFFVRPGPQPTYHGIGSMTEYGAWWFRREEWGLLLCEPWYIGVWRGPMSRSMSVYVREGRYG